MDEKNYRLTYFGLSSGKKGPENLAHGGHCSHTPGSTHNMPVNQISWSCIIDTIKPNWEKLPKTFKNPIFYLFVTKYSLKIITKILNSNCTTWWTISLCTSMQNLGKIGRKLREPVRSEKRFEGRMDRQTVDGRLGIGYAPLTMSAEELKKTCKLLKLP